MGKIKKIIGDIAFYGLMAWGAYGVGYMIANNGFEYHQMVNDKRAPVIREINSVDYFLNNKDYKALMSGETREAFETKKESLMQKLSEVDKELIPYKAKHEKIKRRVLMPWTHLTD